MPAFVYTKSGWISITSQFTSRLSEARVFSDVETAIQQCKRLQAAGVVAVPVMEEHVSYLPKDTV